MINHDEWKKEPGPFGRRYRIVGNTKEYEPTINTAKYGEITLSRYEQLKRKEAQNNE